jgi:hypothetical protein
MKTVYELMVSVARHLSGKSVRVRMTKPEGSDGLCWMDEERWLTIDISPYLDDETIAYILMHEISHAKHHNFIPVTEAVMLATPVDREDACHKSRETEADSQALVWLKYAEKHRDRSLDYLEGMLWALLNYQDTLLEF